MPKLPILLLALAAGLPATRADLQAAVPDPWWRAHFKVAELDDGSEGEIVINVRPEWAPRAAARFGQMMHAGFLIESRFFRVVDGFLAQFGISADPGTNLDWRHRNMKDDPVIKSNIRGTVAFASSGLDSRTTQVFINTVDNSYLDDQGFAVFGEVVVGMKIVDKVYAGYGDVYPNGRGPDQAKYLTEGGDYLQRHFPRLSYITEIWVDGEQPLDRDDQWIQAQFELPESAIATSEPQLRGWGSGAHLGIALTGSVALVFGIASQRLLKGRGRGEGEAYSMGSERTDEVEAME